MDIPPYTKGSSARAYFTDPQFMTNSWTFRYQFGDEVEPSTLVLSYSDGENTADKSHLALTQKDTTDSDADRLADPLEKVLGTNPTKPDTDADGFSDGDEIETGSDPLGPGRLQPSTAGFGSSPFGF
jgi:hypothetical protein